MIVRRYQSLLAVSWSRRHPLAAGLLAYLVIVLVLLAPIWEGGHILVGGPADNQQHVWELAWFAFALTHQLSPFSSDYLRAGAPLSLLWNNSTPLLALLALPLTLGLGAITSFNTLMLFCIFLSASSGFLCLRALSGSTATAWWGGIFFGLSPFMVVSGDAGHLSWVALFLLPILLLLVVKLATSPGRPWRLGALLGLVLAAQLLIAEEVLADSLLLGVLTLTLLALPHPRQSWLRLRRLLPVMLLAALVFIVIVAYPLLLQLTTPNHPHGAAVSPQYLISDLAGLVIPTNYQLLSFGTPFPHYQLLQTWAESAVPYLGLPLLVLLIYIAKRQWRDSMTRTGLTLAAVAFILSLGGQLTILGHITAVPLPWALLRHLPWLDLVSPDRMVAFAYLGIALVLVRFGTLTWPRLHTRRRWAILALVTIFLLPSPIWFTYNPTPAFFSQAVNRLPARSMVLIAPTGSALSLGRAMLWQTESGFRFRIPLGYLIQPGPGGHAELLPNSLLGRDLAQLNGGGALPLTAQQLTALRRELQRWRVNYVVIAPEPHQHSVAHLFRQITGRPGQQLQGIVLWHLRQ